MPASALIKDTTTIMSGKKPHPVDIHVGSRVRMRRMLVGMSQEKLGERLGLTFQQVQKYEKGTNRIGASRLFEISRILDVPVSFFYEGLATAAQPAMGMAEGQQASFDTSLITSADGMALNRAFFRIKDPTMRKRIIDLVKAAADSAD